MKKIKLLIMSVAVLSSFAAAYASRPKVWSPQEYYWNGSGYVMVNGLWGQGFGCLSGNATTCTYILDGGTYIQYRTGTYQVITGGLTKDSKNAK